MPKKEQWLPIKAHRETVVCRIFTVAINFMAKISANYSNDTMLSIRMIGD